MSEFCVVREPVFGTDNSLLGYEIRYRNTSHGAEALARLFDIGTCNQVRRHKPVFMASTSAQLLNNVFQLADPSTITLLLPNSVDASPELVGVIEQFCNAGGTIGLDDLGEVASTSEALLSHASWVHLAVIQLLGIARDPDVTDRELEEVLESDPVLTFQLRQLVNSAAVGLRGVSSIGQALRLVGRAVFQRWLAVAVAASRKSANRVDAELVQRALARGRVMEQVSGQQRDPGTLFLVGLFSLLDSVFRLPIHDMLKRVALSDEATSALFDRQGPYAGALNVAEAYESGQFENAAGMAKTRDIDLSMISERYTSAVKWTAEALDSIQAQPAPAR